MPSALSRSVATALVAAFLVVSAAPAGSRGPAAPGGQEEPCPAV